MFKRLNVLFSPMDEDQIVFVDCENGESGTSTASSSTCTSEKDFKPVSIQGIL